MKYIGKHRRIEHTWVLTLRRYPDQYGTKHWGWFMVPNKAWAKSLQGNIERLEQMLDHR